MKEARKKITQKDIVEEIMSNSFLIPDTVKRELIGNLHMDEVTSGLLEFFDEFHDHEKEVLAAINEEFPNITKQMLHHIEKSSENIEKREVETLVNDINLI